MALVKTSTLAGKGRARTPVRPTEGAGPERVAPKSRVRARATQTASERLAAATQELAGGLTEASSAAEQLRRSMEQISTAAEVAAGASHESLAAITGLTSTFVQARARADRSHEQCLELQGQLGEAVALVETSVEAIEANAGRQLKSVEITRRLDEQAVSIGDVTGAVADIADQTNLLALNAAIVLLVPFFFAGLAVVHAFAGGRQARTLLLMVFYFFLLVSGWPIAMVVGLGVIEQWAGLRRRFSRTGPDQES